MFSVFMLLECFLKTEDNTMLNRKSLYVDQKMLEFSRKAKGFSGVPPSVSYTHSFEEDFSVDLHHFAH